MWIVANVRAFMVARPRFMTALKTPMRISWRLAVATNNANFWPWFLLRKFSAHQFWKECIVRDVCWNICNSSRKLSSSPRKLSQKIIFYFQTFCFIEKEWWKLWDETKRINMVSWQFCHLQMVILAKLHKMACLQCDYGHPLKFPSQIQFNLICIPQHCF